MNSGDQRLTLEHRALAEYLRKYQISPSTFVEFGGEASSSGEPFGLELVFPVHNSAQQPVGVVAFRPEEDRYRYMNGLAEGSYLFNLGRAASTARNLAGERTVIVVEDIGSCLKVHEAGYPNVVALMGLNLSESQEASLFDHFTHVRLMLDSDDEGWGTTLALAVRLTTEFFVKATVLPSRKKPAELPAEAIRNILDTL